MVKFRTGMLVCAASLSSSVFAGTMGPVATAEPHKLFVDGEALYAWNLFSGSAYNGSTVSTTKNGWGGRLGFGVVHYTPSSLSYTAEAGYGYYGKVDFASASGALTGSSSLSALDLLVGANYRYSMIDFYTKIGAMVQSQRYNATLNFNALSSSTYAGSYIRKDTNTYLAPEIKVGGIYNYTDDLGISLSYMYVFGSNNVMNESSSISGTKVVVNGGRTTGPATLSTVMFGLHYRFA